VAAESRFLPIHLGGWSVIAAMSAGNTDWDWTPAAECEGEGDTSDYSIPALAVATICVFASLQGICMLLELCALPDYDGSDKSELKNKCREHAGYRCVNVMKVLIDVGAGIAGLIAILKSANGWSGPGLVTFFVAWFQYTYVSWKNAFAGGS
jgi:hypothetical protein